MDDSILAKFSDDASVLGPFLGNLPPEILDAVVEKFGWFQATSFAMAGRTCREAVGRAGASTRVMSRLTCTCAARDGDLEALKRARRKGCPWGEHTCAEAANGGDLEMLRWARQNGCPWDKYTCVGAAKGGFLEVLRWARQNGCPWDEWTCTRAAEGGFLEMLQWAHENGCPWDKDTWDYADPRCRTYLIEHGCPV
jgi:hypothetical protein